MERFRILIFVRIDLIPAFPLELSLSTLCWLIRRLCRLIYPVDLRRYVAAAVCVKAESITLNHHRPEMHVVIDCFSAGNSALVEFCRRILCLDLVFGEALIINVVCRPLYNFERLVF